MINFDELITNEAYSATWRKCIKEIKEKLIPEALQAVKDGTLTILRGHALTRARSEKQLEIIQDRSSMTDYQFITRCLGAR